MKWGYKSWVWYTQEDIHDFEVSMHIIYELKNVGYLQKDQVFVFSCSLSSEINRKHKSFFQVAHCYFACAHILVNKALSMIQSIPSLHQSYINMGNLLGYASYL